jgi:hypothetical protein
MVVLLVTYLADDRGQPQTVAGLTLASAVLHDRLCEAIEIADGGDFSGAQRVFADRVHSPLHELAAAAATTDRRVAADLLEAKQAVEGIVGTDAASLAALLVALAPTVRSAASVVGDPTPPACPNR